MPRAFEGLHPPRPLYLLATALAVWGCARTSESPEPRAVPVPAVMTVTTGGENAFFALTALDTVTWTDRAAWLTVPAMAPGESRSVTGFTLGPASDSALVFYAMGGRSHATSPAMPMRFFSFLLGQGRGDHFPPDPAPVAEEGPLPDWCESETWIAAFLLEGVGPRPSRPVVVEHRVSGQVHRLVVDPRRNTVRAEPTLRVRPDLPGPGEAPRPRQSQRVEFDAEHSDLIPLFVAWGGRPERPPGSPQGGSFIPIGGGGPDNPVQEWRAYVLAPPPGFPRGPERGGVDPCEDEPADGPEGPGTLPAERR